MTRAPRYASRLRRRSWRPSSAPGRGEARAISCAASTSHDVLTLIDGRPELIAEVQAAQPHLRSYIHVELSGLRAEPYFDYAVDSATAVYGPLGAERASLLRDCLDNLISS